MLWFSFMLCCSVVSAQMPPQPPAQKTTPFAAPPKRVKPDHRKAPTSSRTVSPHKVGSGKGTPSTSLAAPLSVTIPPPPPAIFHVGKDPRSENRADVVFPPPPLAQPPKAVSPVWGAPPVPKRAHRSAHRDKKREVLRINFPVWWVGQLAPISWHSGATWFPMIWFENRHRVLNDHNLPALSVPVAQRNPFRRKKRDDRYGGWVSGLNKPSWLKAPVPWVDPTPEVPLYQHKRWPILQLPPTQPKISTTRPWQSFVALARNLGMDRSQRQRGLQQAQTLVRSRRYKQALILYEKILKREPEDIETLQAAARVAIWLKQWSKAKHYLRRLFDVVPGDVEGYRLMGDWERARGRPEAAVAWYLLYVRIVPQDQEMWRILARTAAQAKRPHLAKQMYQRILQKSPGDREAKAYLANETLLPRFLISLTTTQQLFTRDRIGQYFEPKFGMRFFNRLLVLVGLGIDLRHFATYTTYDLFPHVEAIWLSPRWKDFKANLFVGGTPIRAYYPHLLLEAGATVPVWRLRLHGAYRYTYFAERQAHLFVPGVSFVWEPFLFGVQYYLTLVKDTDANNLQVQHSVRFRAEWQPLWWLVIRAGIGGGDTPDYLLNIVNLPQNGPSAGTEIFAQSIFFFDLNFQFELPHSQFLLFTYRYYQELLFLFPNTPADRATFLHELSLAYRWYF